MTRQLHRALLLLPLLLAAALHTAAAAAPAAVIVKFTDRAVTQARSETAAPAAATAAAAQQAAAAAAARGETAQGQQRAAALAAAAAEAAPGIGILSNSISLQASKLGLQVRRRVPITTVFQGVVLEISGGSSSSSGGGSSSSSVVSLKQQLEKDSSVANVWISNAIRLPTPVKNAHSSTDDPAAAAAAAAAAPGSSTTAYSSSAKATGIRALQQKRPNLDGTGQHICVIDTGVNYKLPLFGSCTKIGKPEGSCRVVTGYDLVGDNYNGFVDGGPATPDDDPMDCFGHGTQVASVAATSNGIAPNATIGAYRVFGCQGQASDAVLIPAIDRAVRDGCHVINLSLSADSGYADGSPYADVMATLKKEGVVAVKAAGNDGSKGGWFMADVTVAAGAASIGSVGGWVPLDTQMTISSFSSFGPNPELTLGPHVCAPGSRIPVMFSNGYMSENQGTSFSSPYTAGLAALWRQHKQIQADKYNVTLDVTNLDHDMLLDALAVTAAPIVEGNEGFVEPLLRCGGGVIQADALIENQLTPKPSLVTIPSNLSSKTYTTNVTLFWTGEPHPNRFVTYNITHVPAYSVPLSRGSYGPAYRTRRRTVAADVTFGLGPVTLDTNNKNGIDVQVTFSLPKNLTSEGLLYSGYLVLTPILPDISGGGSNVTTNCTGVINNGTGPTYSTNCGTTNGTNAQVNCTVVTDGTATGNVTNCTGSGTQSNITSWVPVPQISIPYQGFSRSYLSVRVMAQKISDPGSSWYGRTLETYANSLCYSPKVTPRLPGTIQDNGNNIPDVCSGGFGNATGAVISVSMALLKSKPECSLRATLVPELPIKWLNVSVIDSATNRIAGYLDPIFTGASNSLARAHVVPSYCLFCNGTITVRPGVRTTLRVGRSYRLRAHVQGPLAAADAAIGMRPGRQRVDIRGIMTLTK